MLRRTLSLCRRARSRLLRPLPSSTLIKGISTLAFKGRGYIPISNQILQCEGINPPSRHQEIQPHIAVSHFFFHGCFLSLLYIKLTNLALFFQDCDNVIDNKNNLFLSHIVGEYAIYLWTFPLFPGSPPPPSSACLSSISASSSCWAECIHTAPENGDLPIHVSNIFEENE